jgi:nicotinate-nucleotide adenylyltransferase
VDTLEAIKKGHAGADLFLLLGSDALNDLPGWYEPARIARLAEILVVSRPEYTMLTSEQIRQSLHLAEGTPLRLQIIEQPPMGISSRDLRHRVAGGRSLRYLVPRAVEAYIHDKHLYRT